MTPQALSTKYPIQTLRKALELASGQLVTFRNREVYNAAQRRLKAAKRKLDKEAKK